MRSSGQATISPLLRYPMLIACHSRAALLAKLRTAALPGVSHGGGLDPS
jgi:hypothetical protein